MIIIGIQSSFATDESFIEIGLRIGKSVHWEPIDFDSYEVLGVYGLPWSTGEYLGWILSTRLNVSAGVLTQNSDTEFITTITPGISLTGLRGKISIDGGAGIGFLSDDKIGSHNFGTKFQFTYQFGLSFVKIFRKISLGYRFIHLSDGGIDDGNGLNRNLLELRYRF